MEPALPTARQACQAGNCVDLFTTDLTWVTTNGGNLNGNPWVITQDGTTIRYNVEKSGNCGGANYNTQVGTATATITVGPVAALFSFELGGVGELELPDYDEMTLKFDGQQVGFAHAAGGNKGCVDGPVVFALQTTLPISMAANTVHTFELRFSTNDANFHVNSFYQLDLSFAPQA
ncbi:hypothetical protein D9Q98_002535 [Chlorella vulgaris]|uniref:Uncharacterized protein n=1 Tax=Chlorella vulgaris TaxID=3077 RepID=A0A9D4TTZ8_CHLVU|nr:hypothetical protein D9Q98_002535 [Chlorella vulgaris]